MPWTWSDTLKIRKRITIKMTFQEELIALFKKHGIEYDERYVWS